MTKYNLPVVLLRGIFLLPHNQIKLEFDGKINSNVLDEAELFHDNHLLMVMTSDIDENLNKKTLPKVGIITKILNKIELPNGTIRLELDGLRRVLVNDYLNVDAKDEILESIVSELPNRVSNDEEENALKRKLIHEVRSIVQTVPYISNDVLSFCNEKEPLDKLTDVLARHLIVETERANDYLLEINPVNRAYMLLEDIYREQELFQIERNLDLKIKRKMDDTQKEFILREKMKAIKEELDEDGSDSEIGKLRNRINKLKCSKQVKERLENELKKLEDTVSSSPEVNIIRNYIEWLLDLPWSKSTVDNSDLKKARKILDESHYGLDKVKTRIIEYLAVKEQTKELKGPILCLVGPPGVGKTTLAFSIAKAVNRNFVKISVGGISDEAEIMGHRRTYVGANPGRIISSLKKAKSNNPVFLIDEVDKMTRDFKGDPASSLLSVLDPEQNKYFSDNYIEEEFDLSNVMFILTANYLEDIPAPLRDRLEIIELSGYTEFEKLDIAKKHLFPKICSDHGLDKEFIEISDDLILKIIQNYTKEAGVRELERQLTQIIRKVVTQLVTNNIKMNKLVINNKSLEKYLGKPKYQYNKIKDKEYIGVVNGLAYTIYGGDTLPIEVNYYQGKGNLVLTGSLGDVMKESASIALSYIKANYKYFKVDYDKLINSDIHIHVPEGAVKKDGPSAGIALTLALVSALTNKKVPSDLALTGEITLRGNVLPIGGLKEKSIGAVRSGIKRIIIPEENKPDLDELPKEVKDNIEFTLVNNFKEVMRVVYGRWVYMC